METLGKRSHHVLSLLPGLSLGPSPGLGRAVASLHPGLALRWKFVISLDQPSKMWAHRVPMQQRWSEYLQLPYPMGHPAWAKGSSSPAGMSLALPSSTVFSSPYCGLPGGQKVSTYVQKSANLTLLLSNVWKVVYKHVIFTAALYCYKQDSFMM